VQHARPIGPTTNLQATFSTEMSAGSRPTSPRLFSARNRQGATLSQTTHVAATFIPPMSQGVTAPQRRYRAPFHQGHQYPALDVSLFVPEKTLAVSAQPRYILQQGAPFRQGVQWWTPEVEAFGIESVIGSHPDLPRLPFRSRSGVSLSQTTHDQAAFTADMVDGVTADRQKYSAPLHLGGQWWAVEVSTVDVEQSQGSKPDRPRYTATSHQGQQAWNAEIDLFSVDSVSGWHPDKPRIVLGPRIQLPVSQPTHVSAPFSVDMAQGFSPSKQRYTAPIHNGVQWWTVEVLAFGVEMAIGSRPDRPRLTLGPKIPLPVSQPTHTAATFGPEMAAGWHSDASRAWIAPKRGSSLAQTTHTNAAITVDMLKGEQPSRGLTKFPRLFTVCSTTESPAFAFEGIIGWTPGQSRYTAPFHQGWQIPDREFLFSVDMAQGSHPDQSRAFIAPRFDQPYSQTTHTVAAFSPEMAHGTIPAAKFRGYVPIKIGWSIVSFPLDINVTPSITVLVGGWTSTVIVPAIPSEIVEPLLAVTVVIPAIVRTIVVPPFSDEVTS
jgi:hypothetical protein